MAVETESAGEELRLESLVAMVVGGVLIAVAVLAPLVGGPDGEFVVFGRNYLHDAVHLLTGAAALGAGYYAGGRYAGKASIGLGAVYLLVTIVSIVMVDLMHGLLEVNTADNALHVVLALLLLGTGLILGTAE